MKYPNILITLFCLMISFETFGNCALVENSLSIISTAANARSCGGVESKLCHAVIRCNNKKDESIICPVTKHGTCPEFGACKATSLIPKYLPAGTPTYSCNTRRQVSCTERKRKFRKYRIQCDDIYGTSVNKAGMNKCIKLASGTLQLYRNQLSKLGISENMNILQKEIKKRQILLDKRRKKLKEIRVDFYELKNEELVKREEEESRLKRTYNNLKNNLDEHTEKAAPVLSSDFRRIHKDLALFLTFQKSTLNGLIEKYKNEEGSLREKIKASSGDKRRQFLKELVSLSNDIEKLMAVRDYLEVENLTPKTLKLAKLNKTRMPLELSEVLNNSNEKIAAFNKSLRKLNENIEESKGNFNKKSNEVLSIRKKLEHDGGTLKQLRGEISKNTKELALISQILNKMPILKTHIDRCKNSTKFKSCVKTQSNVCFRHDGCR